MIKKPKVKTVLFSILSRVKSLPHTNYIPFSLKRLKSQIRRLKIEFISPILPYTGTGLLILYEKKLNPSPL